MSKETKTQVRIDEAIKYHNEKFPNKEPLNQTNLPKKLSSNVHKQLFTQWKNKTPKSIIVLKEISDITGYPLKKLVTDDE